MAATNFPRGWHDYVRAHHQETSGYVVAQSGDCLEIGHQETMGPQSRVTGRTFRAIHPRDLPRIELPQSWFMGVVLCPTDDLRPILEWMASLRSADHERIVLYVHPDFNQEAGGQLMRAAHLGHVRTTEFKGAWTDFHHLYGNDHAWQVWSDKP
jgi:hypothetical protein